ncbi:MAG: trans-sulfuration enzyme family protein [Thermomicrobiales bacterium]
MTTRPTRPRGERTRLIHAGRPAEHGNGPSAPPIVPSSTFVMPPAYVDESTNPGANWLDGSHQADGVLIYARHSNPTVRMLENKVSAIEGSEDTVVFGSGMAAATAIFFHLLAAGDHVIVADVCYVGVSEFVTDTLPKYGVQVTRVDTSNPANVAAAMRPNTRLVWIETPANPILKLSDIAAIADIAHAGGADLAVDSTWATPLATRPLTLGADWVLHSLTKYLCGHGDAMGGSVSGKADRVLALRHDARIHEGGVLSPFEAWLIARGMDTLPLRMTAHEAGARQVAAFLEVHPAVERVLYPGLPSHPQYDLARRQMANASGMLAFTVADGPALARKMARELEVFHYAVSLGHQRSLIVYLSTDGLNADSLHLDEAGLARFREFAGDGIFRVSIGLEDPEDLIADLASVLAG